MSERILIIDDDPVTCGLVQGALEREGFTLFQARDPDAGLAIAAHRAPALVILNFTLPGGQAERVLTELRRTSLVPVLLVGDVADSELLVRGLGLGADDHVPRPVCVRELMARTKALLRRANWGRAARELLAFDDGRLEIDGVRHEVRVEGESRPVTRSEFDLLLALAQQPGRAYSRQEIAYRLRGYDFDGDERVVDVHVRNLRRKIECDCERPRLVETVRGVGYRLGVRPC